MRSARKSLRVLSASTMARIARCPFVERRGKVENRSHIDQIRSLANAARGNKGKFGLSISFRDY